MKQLQGTPYNESVVVTVETEATDDRARIDPHVDVVLFSTPGIELLLPENPKPGQSLTIVAFVDAAVENLNGDSIAVPAGSTLGFTGSNGTWTPAGGRPRIVFDKGVQLGLDFSVTDPVGFVPVTGLSISLDAASSSRLRAQATVSCFVDLIAVPTSVAFRLVSQPGNLVISGSSETVIDPSAECSLAVTADVPVSDAGILTVSLEVAIVAGRVRIRPQASPSQEHAWLGVQNLYPSP